MVTFRVDGERIMLREVSLAEAVELTQGRSAGLRWVDGAPFEGTRVAAGMLVTAADAGFLVPGWGVFLIIRSEDGAALGGIGFHGPPAGGRVEIGFDLCESARGNGYATEALRLLTRWSVERPGVEAVVARTEPDNLSSQRVLERADFERAPEMDSDEFLGYLHRRR